jgi:hypothetical protein
MTTELKKTDDGIACYSASLSPPQICDIMSRAIASKADFMGPGDFPAHKTYRVGIVIRNLRTGEETLLTQPTFPPLTPTFSTDWILPYVDHPVFRHFDFASMKTPPYLESPHLRPQDLCTTCTFAAGREEELQAIAFLAAPTDAPATTISEDFVSVEIHTPLLPVSYRPFNALVSQHLRRFYALQHAFIRLALSSTNMSVSSPPVHTGTLPVDAYTNSLYHRDSDANFATDWNSYKIKFFFTLPAGEKTAGARVLPIVLASLRFLIPMLDAREDVAYDILQAHKTSYHFRFRNLAGLRIIGAVNAVIPDFPTLNQTFDTFSSTPSAAVLSPDILTLYPSVDTEGFTATIINAYADAKAALLNRLGGRPAAFQALFRDDTFSNKDVASLNAGEWQLFIPCSGITIIRKYLALRNSTHKLQALVPSNTVAKRVLAALSLPTPSSITVEPFSHAEAATLLDVFFRFCKGLAREVVLGDKSATTGAQLKPSLDVQDKADAISLSLSDVTTFLATCHGNAPEVWPLKLYVGPTTPFQDSTQLAAFMLLRGATFPTAFSLLYPSQLLFTVDASVIASAHNYHTGIRDARNSHTKLKADTNGQKLVNALSYALFTGSPARFP